MPGVVPERPRFKINQHGLSILRFALCIWADAVYVLANHFCIGFNGQQVPVGDDGVENEGTVGRFTEFTELFTSTRPCVGGKVFVEE